LTITTCTAVPLTTPLVVTIAVTLPAVFGLTENVTVSEVDLATVTVPIAPLLRVTTFRAATGSKPRPLIVIVVAVARTLALLAVMIGATAAT